MIEVLWVEGLLFFLVWKLFWVFGFGFLFYGAFFVGGFKYFWCDYEFFEDFFILVFVLSVFFYIFECLILFYYLDFSLRVIFSEMFWLII